MFSRRILRFIYQAQKYNAKEESGKKRTSEPEFDPKHTHNWAKSNALTKYLDEMPKQMK